MSFITKGLIVLFLFTVGIVFLNTGAFRDAAQSGGGGGKLAKGAATIAKSGAMSLRGGPKKKRIAYAITVTKDGPFLDGAIVLGYGALRAHDATRGHASLYEADLVAFVTPAVVAARPILESHGWTIMEKEVPVAISEIENQHYANVVRTFKCVASSIIGYNLLAFLFSYSDEGERLLWCVSADFIDVFCHMFNHI
jgi:hypothetical protein